ncbi:MAG: TIGR03557 family F420-dependent LLM class oxidoreductase [Haloarculaceae archaeon]
MTEIGYALSSELYGPDELVEQAVRAEAAGFDFVSISDHYHPWIAAQGNSPFAWTTLGGVARATDEIGVGTGVTCPIVRYEPAILAQAVATAAAMAEDRFFFGVGTGERLNEHVLGDRWPPSHTRREMLREAVHVMRALWRGDELNHDGEHYTVENARLYTLPETLPPLYVSAYGPKAAKLAADVGDGLYTVGPRKKLRETFESAGGSGPAVAQMSICYQGDREAAAQRVEDVWPIDGLQGELNSQLPTPATFAHAAKMVSKKDIEEGSTVLDPDPETHVENVQTFVDAGYDRVAVHQIGEDLDGFFELYGDEVIPAVR